MSVEIKGTIKLIRENNDETMKMFNEIRQEIAERCWAFDDGRTVQELKDFVMKRLKESGREAEYDKTVKFMTERSLARCGSVSIVIKNNLAILTLDGRKGYYPTYFFNTCEYVLSDIVRQHSNGYCSGEYSQIFRELRCWGVVYYTVEGVPSTEVYTPNGILILRSDYDYEYELSDDAYNGVCKIKRDILNKLIGCEG